MRGEPLGGGALAVDARARRLGVARVVGARRQRLTDLVEDAGVRGRAAGGWASLPWRSPIDASQMSSGRMPSPPTSGRVAAATGQDVRMDTDVSEPGHEAMQRAPDDEGIFATVAVIGAGAMGSGIAQVAATAGHHVVLVDAAAGAAAGARERIAGSLDRLVGKGRIEPRRGRRRAGAARDGRTRCATCPSAVSSSRRCPRTSRLKRRLLADLVGAAAGHHGARDEHVEHRHRRHRSRRHRPRAGARPALLQPADGHGARRGGARRADLAGVRRARRRR